MSRRSAAWTDRDPSERRRIVNQAFVVRSNFDAITDKMDQLREDHREGKETACMVVVGEPGVGKSELLKRYALRNEVAEEITPAGILRRKPVVYAELDPDTTVIGAAETILKELMGPNAPTGSLVKTKILPDQLRLRRTELLIIDEFQHVGERGASITRNRTADWIKSITKKLNIPVVMAGVPVVEQLVKDNAQLDSITPYLYLIPSYDFAEPSHVEGFCEFLSQLDEQLPFDGRARLGARDHGPSLLLACGGNLRFLHRIIAEAARYAIDEGAFCITEEHLRDACDEAGMHPTCVENPFADDLTDAA